MILFVVSLVNLGVDSLSAIKIRNLLKKDYAIDMPLNVLLGQVWIPIRFRSDPKKINAVSNRIPI